MTHPRHNRKSTAVYLDVDDEEERGVVPRLEERHPVLHPPVGTDVVDSEQVMPENNKNIKGAKAEWTITKIVQTHYCGIYFVLSVPHVIRE